MSFKILADTFSVARDSNNYIQLKTLKSPRTNDELWITFKVEGDTKYARSTTQALIDTLDEVFFDNLEVNPYERFENALKEANLTYKNILEKRGVKSIGEISAIIAVFSGNELHLTQTADAEAYLLRKGKLSLISEGLSGRSADLFVNIASGELMPEDKIIFATSRLLRLATPAQLTQMCGGGVIEALDNIRELVLGESELSIGVSCLGLKLAHKPATLSKKARRGGMITAKLQEWVDRVMIFVEEKMEGKKVKMERKKILLALGGVTVILIMSIIFLMNSQHKSALRDEYRSRIEKMNEDLHSANTKGYANDKETANAILDRVEQEAQEILQTEYFQAEVADLVEKIQATRDSINNTTRLKEVDAYADLSEKRESVEALGLMELNSDLFAFEYNALYQVILDKVTDPKTIDEKEVVIKATAMEDQDVLVFLTQSGRILEYNEGSFSFMNTDDEVWQGAVDLAAYGKYLYLLNPEKSQIYKYSRLRSKYSTASEYNLDADLSGAISMAIDGEIYVLKEGGEIVKIFKGEQQEFEIKDMGADISNATEIFTLPEHLNLYVLDPVDRKIVIIQKNTSNGPTYQSQIRFDDLEDVQGFTVDQNEDKLYLLTKKAIYQVEI